jgi:hypothetical protein
LFVRAYPWCAGIIDFYRKETFVIGYEFAGGMQFKPAIPEPHQLSRSADQRKC